MEGAAPQQDLVPLKKILQVAFNPAGQSVCHSVS